MSHEGDPMLKKPWADAEERFNLSTKGLADLA